MLLRWLEAAASSTLPPADGLRTTTCPLRRPRRHVLPGAREETVAFLTGYPPYRKIALPGGRVAQGSERFLDTEEVRGSSPRAPTMLPVAPDCTRLLPSLFSKGSAASADCTGLHPPAYPI